MVLKKTIAVMFGTFNPPHLAHIETAIKCKKSLNADEVHLVPKPASLLKLNQKQAQFKEKIEMCEILAEPHQDWLRISDALENKKTNAWGSLYAYCRYFFYESQKQDTKNIYLACGNDNKTKANILCNIINLSIDFKNATSEKMTALNNSQIRAFITERSKLLSVNGVFNEVSSSAIRNACSHNPMSPPIGTTEKLYNYIQSHGLYLPSYI